MAGSKRNIWYTPKVEFNFHEKLARPGFRTGGELKPGLMQVAMTSRNFYAPREIMGTRRGIEAKLRCNPIHSLCNVYLHNNHLVRKLHFLGR